MKTPSLHHHESVPRSPTCTLKFAYNLHPDFSSELSAYSVRVISEKMWYKPYNCSNYVTQYMMV